MLSAVTVVIVLANGQRTLHGLVLTGRLADALTQGSLVRVQGVLSPDARSLAVSSARVLSAAALMQGSGSVEIEGYVTAVTSSSRFTLGTIEVDARNAVYAPSNLSLTVGAQVEVYGVLAAGLLNATKVEVESEHMLGQAEIKGRITDYVSQSNFVVYGQRCDASAASFSHGMASDLADWKGLVKVTGTQAGDVLKVSTLEFELEFEGS
jgi:primosomal replication protein N